MGLFGEDCAGMGEGWEAGVGVVEGGSRWETGCHHRGAAGVVSIEKSIEQAVSWRQHAMAAGAPPIPECKKIERLSYNLALDQLDCFVRRDRQISIKAPAETADSRH